MDMKTRGYSPRLATTHLLADLTTLPGVATARTMPPTSSRPTMIKVTLDRPSGDGSPIWTTFTIPQAREWLAIEKAD